MKNKSIFIVMVLLGALQVLSPVFAEEKTKNKQATGKLELETLRIQGNKELPRVLFVVPWQNKKKRSGTNNEHRLVLHSLYGDLFDPISPTVDLITADN